MTPSAREFVTENAKFTENLNILNPYRLINPSIISCWKWFIGLFAALKRSLIDGSYLLAILRSRYRDRWRYPRLFLEHFCSSRFCVRVTRISFPEAARRLTGWLLRDNCACDARGESKDERPTNVGRDVIDVAPLTGWAQKNFGFWPLGTFEAALWAAVRKGHEVWWICPRRIFKWYLNVCRY